MSRTRTVIDAMLANAAGAAIRSGTSMNSRSLQALLAYWNEVRRGRLAPRRFEIEPSRIADLLPDTFILERTDGETYRFRLAGTRMCELLGSELRGSDFLDHWSAADRTTLAGQLSIMTFQGAVGYFTLEAVAADARTAELEILLLPLIHSPDTIDRFLGIIAPIDPPNWLGSVSLEQRRLLTSEMIWPDGRPHSVVERLGHQSPFLPAVRSARIVRADRRAFRVYDGGLAKSGRDEA
jgi:hypothetical protein